MLINNVPKKYSYQNILSGFIVTLLLADLCIAGHAQADVLNFFNNNAELSKLVMAVCIPAVLFVIFIIFSILIIKKRNDMKKPNNIKAIQLENNEICFKFYDPSNDFCKETSEIENLEMIINTKVQRKRRGNKPSYSRRYGYKVTVINEITLIFTLPDGRIYEITNGPLSPMDFVYKILENFKTADKIKYTYTGYGDTKEIEEDIKQFCQNGTRRMLVNEALPPLAFAAVLIFLVIWFLYINFFG